MSIIYQQNFDALTAGTGLSGWTNITGTWIVRTSGNITSPNAYGIASPADGDRVVYTSMSAIADMSEQFAFTVPATNNFLNPCIVLRSNAGGTTGYVFNLNFNSGTFTVYAQTAISTFNAVANSTGTGAFGAMGIGTNYLFKAEVSGTTLRARVWVKGTTEPATWNYQATDSSVSAAGYASIRYQLVGTATNNTSLDDLYVGTPGTTFISTTSLSQSVVTTGVSQTITATGVGTAWVSGTTTFGVSGGTGASISGLSISNANQTATFTLVPGSATGTLTITASTGETATVTATAPPTATYVSIAFTRFLANPVIALGQTYGSIVANALAAPAVCYDAANTRWVMMCDMWNIATSKWYNLIFTSPDLLNWTYVSQQAPGGSTYITGNGGLIKNTSDGKFYRVFNSYNSGTGLPTGIFLQSSSDLLTWTDENSGNPVIAIGAGGSADANNTYDPGLTYNPNTSLYECWYIGQASGTFSSRTVCYATSSDCKTWTKQGAQFAYVAWAANFGEPQCFYIGPDRYVTFDGGIVSGQRNTSLAKQTGSTGAYNLTFGILNPEPANAWETTNVFDGCCVGAYDRGDGRGSVLWMLYAGSNITAATDATQSGIGLVYSALPSAVGGGGGTGGTQRFVNTRIPV